MLLDQVIPTYDVASRHTIRVAAEPARVYEAARQADFGRPWPADRDARAVRGPGYSTQVLAILANHPAGERSDPGQPVATHTAAGGAAANLTGA